jgi:hypothetical protein
MFNGNLYANMYLQPINPPDDTLSDAKYPVSGSFIDVSQYTFFAFLVHCGDNWGTPVLQVQQDTSATQTASIKAITGATFTGVAADDDKLQTIEVEVARLDIGNSFRYVTLDVSSSAAEEASILFMAWGARHLPVTQPATYNNKIIVVG